MLYKTIVLELLKAQTKLHEKLRLERQLPAMLEACSRELKASHQAWIETLAANPTGVLIQIESEAAELATKELEDRLSAAFPLVSPGGDQQPLSLDAAMAFIRKHTPPG